MEIGSLKYLSPKDDSHHINRRPPIHINDFPRHRSYSSTESSVKSRQFPLKDYYRRHYFVDDEDKDNKQNNGPPKLMRKSELMVRVYYINHEWKSVLSKFIAIVYLSIIFLIMFKQSDPWYEFFYYLTLQGWTLELVYFMYSLYLDILARWYGGAQFISKISKAAAQALSELVFATQVVIVLFFWIIVYPQERWRSILWELNCHAAGLVLIVIDYLYRFTGFSLRHNKYIILFGISYSLFHYYVVVCLEHQIYPGIDFKSVRSFTILLAGLSTIVFTHKIFYLISNWKWIKEDLKTLIGVTKVVLLRQNSFDMFIKGVPELGSELLSISTPHPNRVLNTEQRPRAFSQHQ